MMGHVLRTYAPTTEVVIKSFVSDNETERDLQTFFYREVQTCRKTTSELQMDSWESILVPLVNSVGVDRLGSPLLIQLSGIVTVFASFSVQGVVKGC